MSKNLNESKEQRPSRLDLMQHFGFRLRQLASIRKCSVWRSNLRQQRISN